MIELKVGGYYRNRKGEVDGPMEKHHNSEGYPFASGSRSFTADGYYYATRTEDEKDLVEEVFVYTEAEHKEAQNALRAYNSSPTNSELLINVWYKHIHEDTYAFRRGDMGNFGFVRGTWREDMKVSSPDCWQPADPNKVKELMIAEHKKRGLFEDTKLKRNADGRKCNNSGWCVVLMDTGANSCWNINGKTFDYETGQWAVPLDERLERLNKLEQEVLKLKEELCTQK